LSEHGGSWRRLFFERTVEDMLEAFDGSDDQRAAIVDILFIAQGEIGKLRVRKFAVHADLSFLFDCAPGLYSFAITFGYGGGGVCS
jgi:hypothetical protein